MADNHDTLIRQVEEELRREQLEKLWAKYAPYAVAAALAIVVGVAGWKFLEARRIAAAQAAGERYAAAQALAAEGKDAEAAAAFGSIAESGSAGYAALAQLQTAGAELKAGKKAEALAKFEQIANNGAGDKLIQDYAALQAAAIRVGDADFTEIENRLNRLTGESGPWRASALELLGLAAFKAGKMDKARMAFEQLLSDRGTPPGVSERVQVLLGQIVAAEMAKSAAAGAPAARDEVQPSGDAPQQ